MTAEHTSLSPEAGYAGVERVPLRRLDDLARPHLDGSRAAPPASLIRRRQDGVARVEAGA